LDYSIKGLSERHIQRIVISNPEFQLLHRDGQWRIEGLNYEQIIRRFSKKKSAASSSESDHAPVTIGKIDIRNAVLSVTWRAQNFRVPFDIEITLQNDSSSLRRADSIIHLYPAGQELVCKAAIDFVRNAIALSLDADNIQLAKFKDYPPLPEGLLLRSNVKIYAKVSSALSPLNFTSLRADLYLRNFKASYKRITMENSRAKDQILNGTLKELTLRPPLHIRLMGKNAQNWEFAVMNLTVSNPVRMDIESFSGILETQADQIRATGNYAMIAAPSNTTASKFNFKPLNIKGHYQAKVKPDGAWDIFASTSSRKAQIKFNQLTFASPSQHIKITGQGSKGAGNIRFDANVSDWQALFLNEADKKFSGKAIALKGGMLFNDSFDSIAGLIAGHSKVCFNPIIRWRRQV